jgi:proline dehydrogenase
MPGETVAEAVAAAREAGAHGVGAVLTCLGENVSTAAEAAAVAEHYVGALSLVAQPGLDAQISVKLTQLGLDLDVERCVANVARVAARARELGNVVWIDMESSPYVDRTLDVYRRIRATAENVGVCVQAYLRRTPGDVDALLPLAPRIRLVKGAYRESESVAFPKKHDVDESFFAIASRILRETPRRPGTFLAIGTHDVPLIQRILATDAARGAGSGAFDVQMLYGIRSAEQRRLAASGQRVRVLISYGESWFPWYMRRLAERPANVWFVAKSLFAR